SRSIAALGIAAHETGHALQHADAYKPLTFRQAFFPVAAFSSNAWVWFMIGSAFLGRNAPQLGATLMAVAIALAALYAVFAIVTLPVEFDASRRALLMLESTRTLDAQELIGAKKVLDAAALTYVASAASAVMTVIYLLLRSRNR
ncbi:MAG TPA: zinc metallopeptidase, partial [Planctomycetota bacterium]|nr:zinc metallopeptidase [Planctomycetota bacterium]